jgi:hypothetical protein
MAGPKEPLVRPANPRFSSGPCAKRPGWKPLVLAQAFLGRSHRAKDGKTRLKLAIDKTKKLLDLPPEFHVGIVPGSDTGAFEMAMWSLLGARGVDVLAWESFAKGWVTDIVKHLKLKDVRVLEADYGASSSPGMAPHPASACPTAIGSKRIVKASLWSTRRQRSSLSPSIGAKRTSSPSLGRKYSVERLRTGC